MKLEIFQMVYLLRRQGGRVSVLFGLALLLGLFLQVAHAVTPAGEPPKDFNHNATGFPLRGAHERLQCETCHMRGFFKGTPTRCSGCHERFTEMEASKKSPNHIPTTQECDVCHDAFLPNVSWQLVRMDHVGIVNNCASCHNGMMAPGKSDNHIPTTQPCEQCHSSVLSFAGARMDHTGIVSGCARCHNGTLATGKSPTHIPSGNTPCEQCHLSTVSFSVVRMDHTGFESNCGQCHNGRQAVGKSANHIPSSNNCENCHQSYVSFGAAKMNHEAEGIVNNCAKCHEAGNPYGVTGRPAPPHPPAPSPCESCHLNTRTWLPVFTK